MANSKSLKTYALVLIALVEVAAQRGRAAVADGVDDFALLITQLVLLPEIVCPAPEYLSDAVFRRRSFLKQG